MPRAPHDAPAERCRRGPGDFDVRVKGRRPPSRVSTRPLRLDLRLIEYHIGRSKIRLLTNLLDPSITPRELATLYHERWESELSFDEIKTRLATVRHGGLDLPFRGRSPAMVEQELWATLLAYNLVRRLLAQAARVHRIDPRRISFTDAVVLIAATWTAHPRGPADLVAAYVRFTNDLADCVLDRWRRPRRVPRVVRLRSTQYPRKRQGARERVYDPQKLLRIGATRCA
jgi:hypothetical protein